jgi:hypothetical protein
MRANIPNKAEDKRVRPDWKENKNPNQVTITESQVPGVTQQTADPAKPQIRGFYLRFVHPGSTKINLPERKIRIFSSVTHSIADTVN